MSHKARFFPTPGHPGKQKKSDPRSRAVSGRSIRSVTGPEGQKAPGSAPGPLHSVRPGQAPGTEICVPPYRHLARVYDRMVAHVNMAAWAAYLCQARARLSFGPPERMLDLGCGTGSLLFLLAQQLPGALELVGLDASNAMLAQARKKAGALQQRKIGLTADRRLIFVRGDLCKPEASVKGRFDWLLSTHDTLNYLYRSEDLEQHLLAISMLMHEDSLYSFDLVHESTLLEFYSGSRSCERFGEVELRQEHNYDRSEKLLCSRLELLLPGGHRVQEIHYQRYYSAVDVRLHLARAGLELVLQEKGYGRPGPADFANYHVRLKRKRAANPTLHPGQHGVEA